MLNPMSELPNFGTAAALKAEIPQQEDDVAHDDTSAETTLQDLIRLAASVRPENSDQ